LAPTLAIPLPHDLAGEVVARLDRLVARLADHGVEVEGPSLTLSYLALRVVADQAADEARAASRGPRRTDACQASLSAASSRRDVFTSRSIAA